MINRSKLLWSFVIFFDKDFPKLTLGSTKKPAWNVKYFALISFVNLIEFFKCLIVFWYIFGLGDARLIINGFFGTGK